MLDVTTCTVGAIVAGLLYYVVSSWRRTKNLSSTPTLLAVNQTISESGKKASAYTQFHEVGGGTVTDRTENAQEMVNQYYDLSTDFYLYGWGESFHFAHRYKGEGFNESLLRHEYALAQRLHIDPADKVLDLGCGVGGPMRNIAKFTGAHITGINNNDYQLTRLAALNEAAGLGKTCHGEKGDFMDLQLTPNSFDAAYAIEATCHAPDRTVCFRNIFNVLKPGARFVTYEWVMTDNYDASNPVHRQLKEGIEVGNALPNITDAASVRKSLVDAGFDVNEVTDLVETSPVTWYEPFEPKWTISGFKTTPIGIKLTNIAVKVMETVKLAPPGSSEMHHNLSTGAQTLYLGGKLKIFTPMLLCVATKPQA